VSKLQAVDVPTRLFRVLQDPSRDYLIRDDFRALVTGVAPRSARRDRRHDRHFAEPSLTTHTCAPVQMW
jgi:hypothetical protein